MTYDYFYGQQAEMFTFYRVPKVLFTEECFWNVSKIMGKDLNRALRDGDGEIYDIIAGDFLVVGLGEEDFSSGCPGQSTPQLSSAGFAGGNCLWRRASACGLSEKQKRQEVPAQCGVWFCPLGYSQRH